MLDRNRYNWNQKVEIFELEEENIKYIDRSDFFLNYVYSKYYIID